MNGKKLQLQWPLRPSRHSSCDVAGSSSGNWRWQELRNFRTWWGRSSCPCSSHTASWMGPLGKSERLPVNQIKQYFRKVMQLLHRLRIQFPSLVLGKRLRRKHDVRESFQDGKVGYKRTASIYSLGVVAFNEFDWSRCQSG